VLDDGIVVYSGTGSGTPPPMRRGSGRWPAPALKNGVDLKLPKTSDTESLVRCMIAHDFGHCCPARNLSADGHMAAHGGNLRPVG